MLTASSSITPMLQRSSLFSSFWVLQGIGWGTYALLWYLASLPVYYEVGSPLFVGAVRSLYYAALGAGVTVTFRPLYRRLWSRKSSLAVLLPISFGCSLLGSGVWLFLFEGIKWPLDQPPFSGAYGASSVWYFARPVVSNTVVLLAWSALYFGIKYQRHYIVQQTRMLRAETLAREAQLQMLRYQLNPHFLFNTLNALLSLIGEDDRRAKQFVQELADFLRYALQDADVRTVSLDKEINVIRSFLSIEKLRFKDDLEIECSVDPAAQSVQIPPYLIQPLVENALKHGRKTSPPPLQVRLDVRLEAETLRIDVANTGRLASSHRQNRSGGIGVKNVRERLQRLYPNRHDFVLRQENDWVRARISIERPHSGVDVEGARGSA